VTRPNTWVASCRYLRAYFKPFHLSSIHSIDRKKVASRINEITRDHGVTSAARARQSLGAFFTWVIKEGIGEANPVVGTNNPGEMLRARDRVLTPDEIRSIWAATDDSDFGKIARLLFLTGCRRDEIGGLVWSEIDLDRGALEISGERTKNHHALRLFLPASAVALLRTITKRDGRGFLFGHRGGAFSAWAYVKLSLDAKISAANGGPLKPWRIHDIRRTVATGMAELGVAPHIVESVLNHRGGHKAGVAGVYNRASYEKEVARALTLWAEHLNRLVSDEPAKVIALRA
jgi:integrase